MTAGAIFRRVGQALVGIGLASVFVSMVAVNVAGWHPDPSAFVAQAMAIVAVASLGILFIAAAQLLSRAESKNG